MVVGALATIGVAFGLYSYVRYEMKVYNTLVLQNTKILILDDFLAKNFPEQVKSYKALQAQKTPAVAPLPANQTPAKK